MNVARCRRAVRLWTQRGAFWVSAMAMVLGIRAIPLPTPVFAEIPPDRATIALESIFPGTPFSAPLGLEFDPASGDAFILEQRGRITRVSRRNGVDHRTLFLDIADRVVAGGEQGLLGLALDPSFATTGSFFVHYSAASSGDTVIARYRTHRDGRGDPQSELIVLTVPQPYTNHNGGQIRFGRDGYLYVALGDGGSAGDPGGYAQNLGSLLGKIVRLDVSTATADRPYRIPPDNPFQKAGERAEIYALGLRNPWRFSFDRVTGDLWAGDVGQNRWEEINRIVRGGNYGWNVLEGRTCFKPPTKCAPERFISPVHVYPHTAGRSVTGGFVYRGTSLPHLAGRYVYGDFVSGRIWGINADGLEQVELLDTSLAISTFGEDSRGELYVVDYAAGTIARVVPASPAPAQATP